VFKEVYGTFIHIKVLKIVVDSMMRHGSSDNFFVYMLKVYKGKDRKLLTKMIQQFSEEKDQDLYGFKEEAGDTEDYFPFAFADIKIPL